MVLNLVILFLAAAILWLLLSSLKLRFIFDEKERWVSLAYTFIRVRADFLSRDITLQLFGAGVKRYGFDSFRKKTKSSEEKPKVPVKDGEKKKRRWDISMLHSGYLDPIGRLLGKIRIKYLDIDITGGVRDPFYTGQVYAFYWVLAGVWRPILRHVRFRPDFMAEKLKFRGKGIVSIRVVHILIMVMQFLTIFIGDKIKNRFKVQRKGTVYGGQQSF